MNQYPDNNLSSLNTITNNLSNVVGDVPIVNVENNNVSSGINGGIDNNLVIA